MAEAKIILPKTESVKYGWNTFKTRIGYFCAISGIYLIVVILISIITNSLSYYDYSGLSGVFSFIMSFIQIGLGMGFLKICLDVTDNKDTDVSLLYSQFSFVKIIYAFLGAIMLGVVIAVGLALLIVPGIYWGSRFSFMMVFIIEDGDNPIDAMKKSWYMTKGFVVELFLFYLLLIGINLLGAIAFGIGLLVSMPVSTLAYAYIYRHIEKQ